MLNKDLFVFGDSWAWGSELGQPEKERFTFLLSKELNVTEKNYGVPGSSLFEINYKVLTKAPVNAFVIVIIPPDSRISTIKDGYAFSTVDRYSEFYKIFSKNNELDYFNWNHNLLIDSICHNLAVNKNKFLLIKNYGKVNLLPFNEKWKNNILPNSLHSILNAVKPNFPGSSNIFEDWDGPESNDFSGKYFEGCLFHPNMLGHQKIAEIVREEIHKTWT
jgi:hypothetical protein